jgi:hypothetical protein
MHCLEMYSSICLEGARKLSKPYCQDIHSEALDFEAGAIGITNNAIIVICKL